MCVLNLWPESNLWPNSIYKAQANFKEEFFVEVYGEAKAAGLIGHDM